MPCVAGVGPAGVGGSRRGLGSAAAGIGVAASPAAIRALARARVRGGASSCESAQRRVRGAICSCWIGTFSPPALGPQPHVANPLSWGLSERGGPTQPHAC